VTANECSFYQDEAGTLSTVVTDSFTNDPSTTGTPHLQVSGREGDALERLPSGTKIALAFSSDEKIAETYLQTLITKARDGASSGSIYFEANLS